MKLLDGADLAEYIKERQAGQIRSLRQQHHIKPKLAVVQTKDDPVIDMYVRMKRGYGSDILVDVDVFKIAQTEAADLIERLNQDESVSGIIVQLPLEDADQTDELLRNISAIKDVDGLGDKSEFTPATALAIDWLLAGYNVDLKNKKIVVVGNGRLVGKPLAKLWRSSGLDVMVCDRQTKDLARELNDADVIVTATGVPDLIKSSMIKPGATVVDAGTATDKGKVVGDLSSDVRQRDDLTITPEKGGVGPLTVAALFDNVLRAAFDKVKN